MIGKRVSPLLFTPCAIARAISSSVHCAKRAGVIFGAQISPGIPSACPNGKLAPIPSVPCAGGNENLVKSLLLWQSIQTATKCARYLPRSTTTLSESSLLTAEDSFPELLHPGKMIADTTNEAANQESNN